MKKKFKWTTKITLSFYLYFYEFKSLEFDIQRSVKIWENIQTVQGSISTSNDIGFKEKKFLELLDASSKDIGYPIYRG